MTTRRICLAFILMMATSHIALAVHTSGHDGPEVISCKLCVCQSQQSHGISPAGLQIPVVVNTSPRKAGLTVSETLPVLQTGYYERAPPAIA